MIPTTMCVTPTFDWHGRAASPTTVYDATTLMPLGQSESAPLLLSDGTLALPFGGCLFIATRCALPSVWWTLALRLA